MRNVLAINADAGRERKMQKQETRTTPRVFSGVNFRVVALQTAVITSVIAFFMFSGCGGGGGNGAGGSTPPPSSAITTVTVSCSPSSILTNQTSACSPTVTGTGSYNSAVTWSVSPTSAGSIGSTGVFTSSAVGTATIIATSTQDTSKFGSASVTVGASGPAPAPSISWLSPSATTVGSTITTVTVNGTNFVTASTVQWNGSNLTTTYVSSSQLTAQITGADLASAGTASVTVVTAAPGGGTSSTRTFTVFAPVSCPSNNGSGMSACISNVSGTPRLILNGLPTPPLLFFGNIEAPADQLPLITQQVNLAAANGIHLYKFTTTIPWTGTDYAQDDADLNLYLAADPNAKFFLEFNMQVVDELGTLNIPHGNDNLFQDGSTSPISLASDAYFAAFEVALKNAINHYETGPYANRIIGYWIGGAGNTSEWFPDSYRSLGLDYSSVNLAKFQQWLQTKYGTDAALSTAWGAQVTFATAAIPVPAAGRFPIAGATRGQSINTFYSTPAQQNWIDYSTYISQLITSRVLTLAQVAKQAMNSAKLVGAYFGYIFELPGSMNGHMDIMPILNSPYIDVLGGPISYNPISERLSGGAGGFMSAADSVALHGKLWLNEDDLNTWLSAASGLPALGYNGDTPTQGFTDTNGILQRNLAEVLTHRGGTYWMDLNADGAFNDSALWSIMGQYGIPFYNDLYSSSSAYTPDVDVLVDETSVLHQSSDWDFLYSARSALRNTIAHTGTEVGYYYLSDFINGLVSPAKVYIFANAEYLTDTQVSQIRALLSAQHATAIWQYAPGFLGGSTQGAAGTSLLTGITVTEADGYPGTTGAGELAGSSWGFGDGGQNTLSPRLVVNDSGAESLGEWSEDQKENSARKPTDGFTSVLLGDFALGNPDVLRELLADAGAHIWIQTDDVMFCDGRNLVLHAASTGTKIVNLPAPLVDASTGSSTITVSMQLGDTQWFRLR